MHVVDDLVDWNYGPDEPSPQLVFDAIGARQDATSMALQQLVGAGLLTPDRRLESFVRQITGLPAAEPDIEESDDEPVDDPEEEDDPEDGGEVVV